MESFSDIELIRQFRDPALRERAFSLIARKYQEKLYWHIRRMVLVHEDADDVLQNTLIKVWRGLHGFRESSGLFTWMYRIATNESITFLKSRQKERSLKAGESEPGLVDRMRSDPWFDGDELFAAFQEAIEQLPPKQKTVFRMRYFDEIPYEEMSKVLKTSVGALKASYFHAVKKIQASIGEAD